MTVRRYSTRRSRELRGANGAARRRHKYPPPFGIPPPQCLAIANGNQDAPASQIGAKVPCPSNASEGKGPRRRGGWRRLPKRLWAVTVGYKCHSSRHLPSGGQSLGISWAPWKPPPPSPFPCIPARPPPPRRCRVIQRSRAQAPPPSPPAAYPACASRSSTLARVCQDWAVMSDSSSLVRSGTCPDR